ncbi:uncharacterized protein SPPG_05953 [Spizellomyces punctatus DAOM BR117]|uniref:PWWP domain-containing protein n=1 Tax=Spizellomyces punctatus (strain DAOM BR117) TaxID=645134 RepID=A0A0L0HE12_SPIPD|nr:uncharacterized protein SPPG_05953 [Spizellomyces punctatus DAOM BR117]KNC99003.1 hypothetical protein SPPG_05953 [Spizellomyces punctatus DAOM BR117]|eukprot:XP_016607043.1 hypothetical protein SPPG_05953 [Spizellomyces punctatus DAOM BR117]
MSDVEEPKSPAVPTSPKSPKSPKSSGPTSIYTPGTAVWARLKGYPWWPGRIEREDELPEDVLAQKKSKTIAVFFFGSRNYSWLAQDALRPYKEHKEEFCSKNKTAAFLKAVREADDPSILEREAEEFAAKAERKRQKKLATPSRRRSSVNETGTGKKKSRPDANGADTKKRRVSEPAPGKKSKKRAIEESDEEEKEPIAERKRRKREVQAAVDDDEENEGAHDTQKEDESGNESEGTKSKKAKRNDEEGHKLLKKLWRIRLKLQGFIKDVKEQGDKLKAEQYEEAEAKLRELESFPLTVDLLKETKVGKLVKHMSRLQIPNDKHNLVPRSNDLMAKLKLQLPEASAAGDEKEPKEPSHKEADAEGEIAEAPQKADEEIVDKEEHDMDIDNGDQVSEQAQADDTPSQNEDDSNGKVTRNANGSEKQETDDPETAAMDKE